MNKEKLLFIAPHLSTGGMPQYLAKLVETLINIYDIYVIEYSDISPDYVVQKNILRKILGDKLISLYGNDDQKSKRFFELIDQINPDIIHLQEIPEMWMISDVVDKLYKSDRIYKIIETSHDSGFNPENKRYFPDSFAFISQFHPNQYQNIIEKYDIPYEIIEYPIEKKERPNRNDALQELGLDPEYVHILNVGLFTPRKNQSEIFEIARLLENYKVKFHFVGNQADNFKFYWGPLMKNVPKNCLIWGERSDVDRFYQAMDLFLFTSQGNDTDKETNPIVIKEAISWQMPIMMYNLPVYCGIYDHTPNILWLKNNKKDDANIIKTIFDLKPEINDEKIKLYDVTFNESENKFIFEYCNNTPRNILISFKDIDSKSCIYSVHHDARKGGNLWAIPTPVSYMNYSNNPYMGGVIVEYFENGKLLGSEEFRLKEPIVYKPEMNITDTEPTYMNYEEFFVEKIYDNLDIDNCKVVFDVGANIGLWTKYILTRNAKKVYCFEPNITAISNLKRNFNGNSNVVIDTNAISHENKQFTLYVSDENSLISSFFNTNKGGNRNREYLVDAITFDDVFKKYNISDVDLIKIDIEGSEFEIFNNLTPNVYDKVKSFLIETHDFYFSDGEEKITKLISILEFNGYQVYKSPQYKFIYASKIRKNYFIHKNGINRLVNLYDSSKIFSWENMNLGKQDGNNHMFNEMFFCDVSNYGCIYELDENCIIEKGDVVVDIGANIGVFANAAYYKGASRILCFEPTILAFNCLIKNKPDKCEIYKAAVSSRKNRISPIYTPDNSDNTMCSTLNKVSEISEFTPIVSIDDLFENNVVDHIDFLKIDTEGEESFILNSISNENYSKINKIAIEYHSDLTDKSLFEDVIKRLQYLGYKMFIYDIPYMPLKIYNFWK